MSKYNLSAPSDPCLPHPSLAHFVDQLDHWHKTEILLLQQTHALLRPHLSLPLSVPLSTRSCTLPTLPTLLPLLTLQPLPGCEKLLLKQAQLVLKAARPAEPRAPAPQDDPQDYSKTIAVMRKEYLADVDEYERSGLLKIPPLPDPCGAGILPAPPAAPSPPAMPPSSKCESMPSEPSAPV